MQQIGGSFGTAVLAVILTAALAAHPGNLSAGFDVAFWWAAGFSVVAVLLSLWLPGAPRTSPGTRITGAPRAIPDERVTFRQAGTGAGPVP